jgi:N utilization substance protein B
MQLLFSQSRDESLSDKKVIELYDQSIKKSFELYLYNLYLLLRVTEFAEEDAKKRHGKYLPKPEDLLFSPKILTNVCTQSLLNNKPLKALFTYFKFEEKHDPDMTRKVYYEFSKTEEYYDYVYDEAVEEEGHRKILLSLFKAMIKNELIAEMLDDYYANWLDDKSLIIGIMKKAIKMLPREDDFFNDHRADDDTTKDFGLRLIHNVIETGDIYKKDIEEIIQNWDVERVAVVDMILLKMAAAEFQIFENIPGKVTINEYMEISKLYSTEKSKDFINGILDKLYNLLIESGVIKETPE